ncbi:MAG: Gfo/Idh/MocA family oxidoreductase [Clostridia bacterium]|nr:Gfo/Idh/MocA family oxidoreductase [Clostridia bacterium]
MSDKKVKLGIIGIGNQGGNYLKSYANGNLPEIEITCVADIDERRFENAREKVPGVVCFKTADELIASGLCEAVVIATPHYYHPPMVIDALKGGLHALSEKPAGVYTKQVREAIAASENSDKTYAMMFNQRTNCIYRKVRELVQCGEYGEMRRVSWIITDWFRTQAYYDSGSWRATWAGEGGGVMLNQCPHQLDLWQWICGMPNKVRAVCHEGKWHNIEVEDDVTIYVEYPNGATGTFITSTGDFPGANRLEITMDKAKILCEYDLIEKRFVIKVFELEKGLTEFSETAEGGFDKPVGKWTEIETDGKNNQHEGVLNAFAAHILRGEPLVAEGPEGINGLTISNAAFLSSWLKKDIEIPFDEDLYYEMLQEKIKNSKFEKVVREQTQQDMSSTF